MSVGVFLITHDDIGISLIDSLQQMFANKLPLNIKALPVHHNSDPLAFCYYAEEIYASLEEGDGVLVLTDLFGATPCNIAISLLNHYHVKIVAGLNFPMLVKIMSHVFTFPDATLDTLVDKALTGGCQGVLDVSLLYPKSST
ncbi:phosphotransferase system, mannose/fructose-specific component IIA [Beggiatoa alba B18LD]|uniref:Phosphotransferase system, mannose/fructose-specific component IIA n=1 Tax=Beggiatoa alba B18LD TaxID=395493 RepID=I3CDA9_9GAMM|nr:phosphotransferase system, mannose/fructose-specific component IIA [Beggiatoa alba]EIJ41602.1 phosphotransferase system, mannose/fructose-specific component IIA [Beggiatoa alba B18LD]